MQVQHGRSRRKVKAAYSLQVESPRRRAMRIETFASLPAAIARAAQLIRSGSNVGIWSAVSLEKH